MFKSILIPISSEFYPPAVFQISAQLIKKSQGTITSIYIAEKKKLDEVERLTDTHLSLLEEQKTSQQIRREHLRQAEQIVFNDAKAFLKKRNIELQTKYAEGEFGEVIKKEVKKHHYDLIVMGYDKQCFVDYRLLDELNVSLWVASGVNNDTFLAICSNLSPNKKVPVISQELSILLDKKLYIIYIVDPFDPVQVDEKIKRSEKKSKEVLVADGYRFIDEMQRKGISAQLVIGNLEKEIIKASKKIKPMLVIIGREQKLKGVWGFPVKNIKRKVAKHCECSFLFIN